VEDIASVDATFAVLRDKWGKLDFMIHAIGFADKNELKGRYADTSRENFSRTMVISCFSFTEVAKCAAELMTEGGSMVTLTFGASERAMPNYNVMGVAKAALEASVRYLAADFGPRGIRVNVVAPGAIRTPIWGPATATPEAEKEFEKRIALSTPLGRLGETDHVAKTVLFLASDDSAHVQGQEIFVDGGAVASPSGAPIYRG
ncbi:SDR family oxidoreductase, partial [Herbaspirillum sp. HC18]